MSNSKQTAEAKRLENLWSGEFGDQYVDRNIEAGKGRQPFWQHIFSRHPIGSTLEVGCNVGANTMWIAQHIAPEKTYGVDVSLKALAEHKNRFPHVNAIYNPGRQLIFRDQAFDLTFTTGVLIHQPESTLPLVMSEIIRCSRKYVLCGEYHSDETVEVPYRGQEGALFKRNYEKIYLELFPELKVIDGGFLSAKDGWDDITWVLFEKTQA